MPLEYEKFIKPEFQNIATAIKSCDLPEVKRLINPANINAKVDTQFENSPLIVSLLRDQFEIAEFIITQKCNLEAECIDKSKKWTALSVAIDRLGNSPSHLKMVLLLIERGADTTHSSVIDRINKLNETHYIRKLIERLNRYKTASAQTKSDLANEIGCDYEELLDDQAALKWLKISAKANYPHGMYNYARVLLKQNKLEEAIIWYLKCYEAYTSEADKLDVIEKIEKALSLKPSEKETKETITPPQRIFNIFIKLANQQREKQKAVDYLLNYAKAEEIVSKHNLSVSQGVHKLLQAGKLYSTALDPIQEGKNEESLLMTQLTKLFAGAVCGGEEQALPMLINMRKQPSAYLSSSIAACYALTSIEKLPDEVKKENDQFAAEHQEYIEGLKALDGWCGRQKINAPQAIVKFKRVAETKAKSNPLYAGYAHIHILASHCHIANGPMANDEIKSERIIRSIPSCEFLKGIYPELKVSITSRYFIFKQLFQFIKITTKPAEQKLLITLILEFYRLEAKHFHTEKLLQNVFEPLFKLPILFQNFEVYKNIVDTLIGCHCEAIVDKTNLAQSFFIKQLEQLNAAELLASNFRFASQHALAQAYALSREKTSLQTAVKYYETAKSLSESLEEKIDAERLKTTCHRLGDILKRESTDQAIEAYTKAVEYGDIDAALKITKLHQLDENALHKAIEYAEKALTLASKTNNIEKIILTIEHLSQLQREYDLSTKDSENIDRLILSAKVFLNNEELIKPHLQLISRFRDFYQHRFENLFAVYDRLKQQADLVSEYKKLATEIQPDQVIQQLLTKYSQLSDSKEKEICKTCLWDYACTQIETKSHQTFELMINSLFSFNKKETQALQIQLIKFLEETLTSQKIKQPIKLYNFYKTRLVCNNESFKANETERHSILLEMLALSKSMLFEIGIRHNLQVFMNEKYKSVREGAQACLNTIEYKEDKDQYKMCELAQRNYLPSVYDVFLKYQIPTFFGREHVRRPLYLATKMILLTMNSEAAATLYDLPKERITSIKSEAEAFLKKHQSKDLTEFDEYSDEYRYIKLSRWYQIAIDNAKSGIITNPDAYLLTYSNIAHEGYNQEDIMLHVRMGMKQALEVDDEWVDEKLRAKPEAEPEQIPQVTAPTESAPDKVEQVVPSAPSRPVTPENIIDASVKISQGFYPTIVSDYAAFASSAPEPANVFPILTSSAPVMDDLPAAESTPLVTSKSKEKLGESEQTQPVSPKKLETDVRVTQTPQALFSPVSQENPDKDKQVEKVVKKKKKSEKQKKMVVVC